MRRSTKLGLLLAAVSAVAGFCLTNKPDETTSNVVAWLRLIRFSSLADRLPANVDSFAWIAVVAGLLGGTTWALVPSKNSDGKTKIAVDDRHIPRYAKIGEVARRHFGLSHLTVPDPEGKIDKFLRDVRQHAVLGHIHIYGRKTSEREWAELELDPLLKINPDYWQKSEINEYEFLVNDGWTVTCHDHDHYDDTYSDLHIEAEQTERLWPARMFPPNEFRKTSMK